ncbi:hypothetical protein [Massilia sp. Root335]|jgi:hypothetical protein|uniref:hypothetical protein n=1 Tax=Massilia sp. Root335 TaxID=1736517 RepID=UPI0006F3F475|nr:hypothetical protein [Massilia sp. Root335]KQV45076.1 hypothetical protein ASC93_00515 [Massilia sp. Root335]
MVDHPHVLHSWREAQEQITTILARLNRDPALLLAAMANPLAALRDIGFDVAAEVRQEFEDRIRFGEQAARRLAELRDTLRAAGLPLPPEDEAEAKAEAEADLRTHLATLAGVPGDAADDVDALLEQCRGRHPHIDALIEYRTIQHSRPPFARADVYERIRRGETGPMPLTRVRARLHGAN